MSIKRILGMIEKPNLVPMIMQRKDGEELLSKLGKRVQANHLKNETSMADWSDLIDAGMDVAKFEDKGSDYPWTDAANYKSPLITEAVRQFGDKAKMEIMKKPKLVACKVEGMESEEINESCSRIEKHMNWQINTEMPDWRKEQTRALYTLAGCGSYFKKTFFDATEGCNKSKIVKYPNFSFHQEASNINEGNFTEIMYYYPNDIYERKSAGIWEVPDKLIPAMDSKDAEDEQNFCFIEQFTTFDLDGDGYEEPLIVTCHKNTGKVVRIVTRYDVEGIHVRYNDNTYNLQELVRARTQPPTNKPEFNKAFIMRQMDDIEKNSVLVRIVPEEILSYFGFIEDPTGAFLCIGYLHILASPIKGVNKTTNALLNAGELANMQGGWLSKEHRDRKSGTFSVKPGYFKQTNISAQNLQNSVFGLPFKEPSGTLLALNQEIKGEIKELSARFNYDDAMKSGVSAASVLGALQEGVVPTSSLMMNVISAMGHEFKIMFNLNSKYTEPLIYKSLTGTDDFERDYGQAVTISPTANADLSNQMQRIVLAQAQLEQLPVFLQVGGNPEPMIRGYYDALGTPNMDQLFPAEMTSEEQQTAEKMLQAQEGQVQFMQQQLQLMQQQLQLSKVDTDRRVFEAQFKAQKEQAQLQQQALKLESQIIEMQRKSQREDAEIQFKARKELAELQLIRADVLKRLAEVDKTVSETAQIEQTLITGDINAIQSLNDNDLLAFIGVQPNGR